MRGLLARLDEQGGCGLSGTLARWHAAELAVILYTLLTRARPDGPYRRSGQATRSGSRRHTHSDSAGHTHTHTHTPVQSYSCVNRYRLTHRPILRKRRLEQNPRPPYPTHTMVSEQEVLDTLPKMVAKPPKSQTGFPGYLTDSEKSALEQLRIMLEAEGHTERMDDSTLLRFLRARKFDIMKAKEMYEACEKWRQEFGTNTILTDFHYTEKPTVAKFYPQYYHKTDVDGRPVYIEELGAVNITEMYKITTQERMLKNLVWEYEAFTTYRLPACSRKAGSLIETSCTILDLKGISISAASQVLSYVREASYIGQNYYPERMGKFYLINAPFGFSTAFRLFKPFLDPVTVSKIFILGSSYKKELLAQIPAENLPTKFGGSSEVSEAEGGLYLSDVGPWRDPKFIGPEGEAPKPIVQAAAEPQTSRTESLKAPQLA